MRSGRFSEQDSVLEEQLARMGTIIEADRRRVEADRRREERDYRTLLGESIASDGLYSETNLMSPADMAGAAAIRREAALKRWAALKRESALKRETPRMAAESAGPQRDILDDIFSPLRQAADALRLQELAETLKDSDKEEEIKALASPHRTAAGSAGKPRDILEVLNSPRRKAADAAARRARSLRIQELDEKIKQSDQEAKIKALTRIFRRSAEAATREPRILGLSSMRSRDITAIGGKRRTFKHYKKTKNKKRRKRKTKTIH
jgi:hypothetical protein